MTDDINVLSLYFEGGRISNQPSTAKEERYYHDPANTVRFESEKRRKPMQRDLDQTEKLLLKWADSMKGGQVGRGFPSKSLGMVDSWIKDNEDLTDAADDYEIGKINAAIDSLIQPHRQIIYKKHNLSYMVWRFSDEDALYHAAKSEFRKKYFCRG